MEIPTVPSEIIKLFFRNLRKGFSIQTMAWNFKVGANIHLGGMLNASTGYFKEVTRAYTMGNTVIAAMIVIAE